MFNIYSQVEMMGSYSVLVAVNGAGLTNALFLPPHAVPVQIVPYKAELNYREFERLLRTRGEYAEWHNTHENLTRANPNDKFSSSANTIVHLEEFRDVVETAMSLVRKQREKLREHSEL